MSLHKIANSPTNVQQPGLFHIHEEVDFINADFCVELERVMTNDEKRTVNHKRFFDRDLRIKEEYPPHLR
jgi:hypothetical protein